MATRNRLYERVVDERMDRDDHEHDEKLVGEQSPGSSVQVYYTGSERCKRRPSAGSSEAEADGIGIGMGIGMGVGITRDCEDKQELRRRNVDVPGKIIRKRQVGPPSRSSDTITATLAASGTSTTALPASEDSSEDANTSASTTAVTDGSESSGSETMSRCCESSRPPPPKKKLLRSD